MSLPYLHLGVVGGVAGEAPLRFVADPNKTDVENQEVCEAQQQAVDAELVAVKQALSGWAEQCDVTPEEFAKYFACVVDREFETSEHGGLQLHFTVHCVQRGPEPPWRIKPKVLR